MSAVFNYRLTNDAFLPVAHTNRNTTTMIIVAPDNGLLFSYEGNFTIVEIEAANSTDYIPVILPSLTSLQSAYPNPFNPITNLKFGLPVDSKVAIQIYNLQGRVIETLVNRNMNAGYHSLVWNANEFGSGIYFVQMIAGEYMDIQKLMLVK